MQPDLGHECNQTSSVMTCMQPEHIGHVCNQNYSNLYATNFPRARMQPDLGDVYNQISDMYATRIPRSCIQSELLGHVCNQNTSVMYTTRTPWTGMQPEYLGHVYNQTSSDTCAPELREHVYNQSKLLGHIFFCLNFLNEYYSLQGR